MKTWRHCAAALFGVLPAEAIDRLFAEGDCRIVQIPDDSAHWRGSAQALWESRYLSEGRDNLAGESLASVCIEGGVDNLSASLWLAQSPDSGYREEQLGVAHSWEWGRLDWEVSANLIWLPDGERDQEVGLRLVYPAGEHLEVHWQIYHSMQAHGFYHLAEVVSPGWEAGGLELDMKLGSGFNGGYVADGHRGLDHLSAAVEACFALNATWRIVGNLLFASAVGRNPGDHPEDSTLHDGWHFGAGMIANF